MLVRISWVLLVHLISVTSFGQTDSIVRYWHNTYEVKNPSNAKTRAVYQFRNGLWYLESRFLANNSLYVTGSYKDRLGTIKEGEFRWYYANGILNQVVQYTENEKDGLFREWDSTGHITDSFIYKKEIITKGYRWNNKGEQISFYDLDENGNGKVRHFKTKDSLTAEGYLVAGKKQGAWTYYRDGEYPKWIVTFEKDSVLGVECFTADGSRSNNCIYQKLTEPPGGQRAWMIYLNRNIENMRYPSKKVEKQYKNLYGKTAATFMVDEEGYVKDIRIIDSINPEADRILIQVLTNSPRWTPGVYFNKPVKSYFTQPITLASPE